MVASGLKAFKKQEEARKTSGASVFFKPEPGQKVRIRPLVELDEDGKNYDPKFGTANFVREYVNPEKFWLSIVDVPGEENIGRDMVKRYGWYKQSDADPDKGQHSDRDKNWNPKQRFYLPVVVDRLDGSDLTVEVLQLAFGDRAPAAPLVEFYENKGSITDRWWDYSRNEGKGLDTKYSFIPDDPSDFDISAWEIPDITDAPYVNVVPYEDQAAFLQVNLNEPRARAAEPVASSVDDTDEDW